MKNIQLEAYKIIREALKKKINICIGGGETPMRVTDVYKGVKTDLFYITCDYVSFPLNQHYHDLVVKDYLGHFLPLFTLDKDDITSNLIEQEDIELSDLQICPRIWVTDYLFVEPGHFVTYSQFPIIKRTSNKLIIATNQEININPKEKLTMVYSYLKL